VKVDLLIGMLETHKVLHHPDGFVSFRHRYMYYYFVAESFAAQLVKRSTRDSAMARLKQMAKFIAYEEYSQILMFVIYKTRNEDLIEELIRNADLIYEGRSISNLHGDVAFANRLDIERPEMCLPSESITESRDARRKAMLEPEVPENDIFPQKVSYSDELDWAAKLQYGFKTVQMLGRVLRNFPGTLEADQKEQLAVGAYGVSLRMLGWILEEAEKEKEEFRKGLLFVVEDSANGETATDRFKRADALLSSLITLCCFGVVRFLSIAVGSSKLDETYKKVSEMLGDTPAAQLIDIAIRMDFFRGIPVEALYDLNKRLEKNFIANQVLRLLVWQRLTYLPIEDRNLKNQICSKFEISGSSAPVVLASPPRKA